MLNLKTLALGAAIAVGGGAAQSATIEVFNDNDVNTTYLETLRGSVDCTNCSVLTYEVGSYDFSTAFGELFDGPDGGNSPSAEAAWLNTVLGLAGMDAYTATDDDKTEDTDDGVTYWSDALYVILKIGRTPNYTILRNDGFGQFSFAWNTEDGEGSGLSHFTEIGMAAIPLPAGGVLLLTAIGGLALARRRKA